MMDLRGLEHYKGDYGRYPRENKNTSEVITVGEWVVILIILAIPLVNFIMYFIWAFGGGTNKNKQNFCRASLILIAIGIVLSFLIY